MSAYHGHKNICNLLLNTKGINVNAVTDVSLYAMSVGFVYYVVFVQ